MQCAVILSANLLIRGTMPHREGLPAVEGIWAGAWRWVRRRLRMSRPYAAIAYNCKIDGRKFNYSLYFVPSCLCG
jgi:hypothetical protein